MRVISIDPGDHIGCVYTDDSTVWGETIEGDDRNKQLWKLLNTIEPEVIVYESFALRQSAAQKLVGNKFITCEVIGVIKLYAQLHSKVKLVSQIPATKEYCGFSSKPRDEHYKTIEIVNGQLITEHVRDAFRLYSYYKLFGEKK